MKVELMTVNGKSLVYSNVQKVETLDKTIQLHCPDEPIVLITFDKNKIVKLVSYI